MSTFLVPSLQILKHQQRTNQKKKPNLFSSSPNPKFSLPLQRKTLAKSIGLDVLIYLTQQIQTRIYPCFLLRFPTLLAIYFFLALTVCINIHIFTSSPFHEKQKLLHHTRRARVSQNKVFANKVQVKEWGSKKEKIWNKTYTKVRKKHLTSVWLGVCVCEWGKKKSCSKFDSRWRDEQTNWTIQVSLPLKEKELSLPTRVRMWFWWLVVVVAMGGGGLNRAIETVRYS